jgi:hypothetical protein
MNQTLEILKYLLPSLVVLATTIFLVRSFFVQAEKERKQQLYTAGQHVITPLKLQAYERVMLFLERISPESLIVRVNRPGYTCQQLHGELLNTIRSEYEHNLSQQIYLSSGAWEMVKNARGRTIQLINTNAEKIQKDLPSIHLSKSILESIVDDEKTPTTDAIAFIKNEFSKNFG